MSSSNTITSKETTATEAQPNGTSDYGSKLMQIKPLPQGRPIATNASTGIAELLGYLD